MLTKSEDAFNNLHSKNATFILWTPPTTDLLKNTDELLNLRAVQFSPGDKGYIFQCMVIYFVWNFKGTHTKYRTIHWKLWFVYIKILSALRFWNAPPPPPPPPPPKSLTPSSRFIICLIQNLCVCWVFNNGVSCIVDSQMLQIMYSEIVFDVWLSMAQKYGIIYSKF